MDRHDLQRALPARSGRLESITTSHAGILSLIQDREGNLWAGTSGGGLNRIRQRAIILEDTQSGLPFPSIESICEGADGAIWRPRKTRAGAQVGRPLGFDSQSDQWPGDATCVTADAQGRVWVGTRQNGLHCWRDGKFVAWGDDSALRGQTIHTLLASKSGDLWIRAGIAECDFAFARRSHHLVSD